MSLALFLKLAIVASLESLIYLGPTGAPDSYGERLAEIGAVPSTGTLGDSYDNALAETVSGYHKPS